MMNHFLMPSLEELRQEYVLIQAWKKTSDYIRYHNWYADTLKLDWATANLREFIDEVRDSLSDPDRWESYSLRVVPAPKSVRWHVSKKTDTWKPVKRGDSKISMRPLAHVNLRDQVIATAIMLCLADRVETQQGDPRNSIHDVKSRKKVISYGNRLLCYPNSGMLRHRWGSTKLYRSYFEDYRSFVSRPTKAAESIERKGKQRVFIVESDLSKFYDRVRPNQLHNALRIFQHHNSERGFFDLVEKVFDWCWHPDDSSYTKSYATQEEIEGFDRVALPQGLVSAGFFANITLLSFDQELRNSIGGEITTGIHLEDACRYVDDLRFVVSTEFDAEECQEAVGKWLEDLLKATALGLRTSEDKTKAAEFGGSERPFIRQSVRMERIRAGISMGFDVFEGEAILDAIQGLMSAQRALSLTPSDNGWEFSPIPDVRAETVSRFSANRFRSTYRSIRPLLEEKAQIDESGTSTSEAENEQGDAVALSKADLDEEAKAFALSLIEGWVEDPSQVRLLRIGLDIWPDHDILRGILNLLKPLSTNARRPNSQRIAWYCLSEILRAGVTETGLVEDEECLPEDIDLQKYRETLREEATRLIQLSTRTIPWYLRQQALLFLAVFDPSAVPPAKVGRKAETLEYLKLLKYLQGENNGLSSSDFAVLAVIARRAISSPEKASGLARWNLNTERKEQIAIRDPSFALELSRFDSRFFENLSPRIQEDLCFRTSSSEGDLQNLADIVLKGGPKGSLRNELSLLQFASKFCEALQKETVPNFPIIAPSQVGVCLNSESSIEKVLSLKICKSQTDLDGSIYAPPHWCKEREIWRFQLGFLLRFILGRQPDFTTAVRPGSWKEHAAAYRQVRSHWLQRIYGFYNGQEAFGDDWLPISDWMEGFLLALLGWPGCSTPSRFEWVNSDIVKAKEKIDERIESLRTKSGSASGTLLMPMDAKWPAQKNRGYSLRACVVQTVIPEEVNKADITFSNPKLRRSHQNHLSAALAAVRRMLKLRASHSEDDGFLDWLILPELAVHPQDVKKHLFPFARAYKTMILAGLTYEDIFQNEPPVNSALWIIPKWSRDHGWWFQTRRQGKRHLAPNEKGVPLQSFRPCQWLIEYKRSMSPYRPLRMTASVCYDATDLSLAADLRDESDIYAIPSFNKDVRTFDQMALALHYHMFQLVVVANNGLYGGSNAYWPLRGEFNRQIFHLHGQPQASIAFFEVDEDDIRDLLNRGNIESAQRNRLAFKAPPAGWKPTNPRRR